ncbi:MAG: M1 family metallopeptidase [Leptolyngbyaceae bacterium]|nr:M1 family metallopeptidase [Leptolyngbyaceae bacterium]
MQRQFDRCGLDWGYGDWQNDRYLGGVDGEKGDRRSFALPGSHPHYNPDRPGQVNHILLELNLDIPNRSYQGLCSITLTPVQSGTNLLVLDAVDLRIDQVLVGQTPQWFSYDGNQLQIQLAQPMEAGKAVTVAIAYHVHQPQRGLYFIGPDEHYPNHPTQVWTQGEDEDSRYWFPCFDYPGQLASSEIKVRVPKAMTAISNGELVDVIPEGDDRIYHWHQKEVHPTYLMTLAVGEFAEIHDEWQGKPVSYYVEKGRKKDAKRTMGKTPRMMDFLSRAYGYPYPFPKYAQVCVADFIFGGMENTSTTLLTDRCLLDERAALDTFRSESLVVHELAHQWFGDLVVIKHWSHAWVKEGMATYSEVMWTEQEYGAADAAYYRLNEARSYISEDKSRYRRPMVTHVYREAIELYDRHIYEKGACVYHMIRAELGDDLFQQAIHTFVQDNAHQTVETIDLVRAIDKATGRNLQFLLDQYVLRGGHPDYKVTYGWDHSSKLAKITVTQTQVKPDAEASSDSLFDLNIPIGFGFVTSDASDPAPKSKSGQETEPETKAEKEASAAATVTITPFTVRIHERQQTFYFPLPAQPDFISFDVGNHWLKTVNLDYPLPKLIAQAQHDPDPISQIYAIQAIGKKGGLEAVQGLARVLTGDRFWGVRLEAAKALATVKLDQVFAALLPGLSDGDVRVRRAVVQGLAQIKTKASYKALKAIAESGDPSYWVEADAVEGLGAIAASFITSHPTPSEEPSKDEKKVIKILTSVLETRQGWNEVVRSGAIAGLSKLTSSEAALDAILPYTELGTPQPLRLAAIRALGAIAPGQTPNHLDRILNRLEVIASETFFLTQVAVVTALGKLETLKAANILERLADQTPDGRVRRRAEEMVAKVRKAASPDTTIKKLQSELDQLKKDNQELRSRLERLEAKDQNNPEKKD